MQELTEAECGIIHCSECGATVSRRHPRQEGCGRQTCRDKRRWKRVKADTTYEEYRRVANQRAKIWYTEHREMHLARQRACRLGITTTLPGAFATLGIEPAPKWPIEHRNVRALHGAMSTIIGKDHDATSPAFALIPSGIEGAWVVYLRNDEDVERLAGRAHRVVLFDHERSIAVGPPMTCSAPAWPTGPESVRIWTRTPVVIRANHRGWRSTHFAPTSDSLVAALTGLFQVRLGIEPKSADVVLISHNTIATPLPIGGKFGTVTGWAGEAIVRADAAGAWLLKCAARVGLGGRTALGFGRIGLEVLPC